MINMFYQYKSWTCCLLHVMQTQSNGPYLDIHSIYPFPSWQTKCNAGSANNYLTNKQTDLGTKVKYASMSTISSTVKSISMSISTSAGCTMDKMGPSRLSRPPTHTHTHTNTKQTYSLCFQIAWDSKHDQALLSTDSPT